LTEKTHNLKPHFRSLSHVMRLAPKTSLALPYLIFKNNECQNSFRPSECKCCLLSACIIWGERRDVPSVELFYQTFTKAFFVIKITGSVVFAVSTVLSPVVLMPIVEKSFLYTCSSIFKLVPIKILCNGPLSRARSSASSTRLLARPSLFGDGPVLTGAFPFLFVSRFPDGIATIKQQTMSIYFIKQSEARTDDDVTTNTLFWQLANRSCKQPLPYSASDLHVQFFIR
ncbi:hypothetical protein T12_1457, partial [Trichinella patagoniensis]